MVSATTIWKHLYEAELTKFKPWNKTASSVELFPCKFRMCHDSSTNGSLDFLSSDGWNDKLAFSPPPPKKIRIKNMNNNNDNNNNKNNNNNNNNNIMQVKTIGI